MPIKNKTVLFNGSYDGNALEKALSLSTQDIIIEVRESGLKGRGGAGFPTGTKWMLASAAIDEKKYVVCNADEGEPGTFKDRVLLEEFTRQVFDGMTIAGYAIGAEYGFVYLRGEYRYLFDKLNTELQKMRDENRLGKNILGKNINFDIEIRMGAGAYICGEESALIESLEGFRGEARNRPPYPVNRGYKCYPTIVNNVETFALAPIIIAKGSEWFKTHGTSKSTGTKLLSISGDCEAPGVYEVPFGITINAMLDLVGAKHTKAVQVGGASGYCVSKAEFNRQIAFEDIPTGGSIIIFNETRDMLHILKNFMEFFVEESCGQCTPCRIGNRKLLDGIEKIEQGTCSISYVNELVDLGKSMQISAKCGLGQSSPNAFISIINHFENEIFSQR